MRLLLLHVTQTSTPPETGSGKGPGSKSLARELVGRISRLEFVLGGALALILLLLVLIEPDILEAPFENGWTLLFTFGGTALAATAFAAMLWFRVPVAVRVPVLLVPFLLVNWWLISPYFVDEVVDEGFSTSISEQLDAAEEPSATTPEEVEDPAADPAEPTDSAQGDQDTPAAEEPTEETQAPPQPTGPVLLGAGEFVGLAGHSGTGDAAIFENPDGSLILRFENFDIENGPDLEVYLVPGADQTSLPEGSIHLGALKGNIGDQNYDLPPGTELASGAYTVLVWCEAFSVEFVGATLFI